MITNWLECKSTQKDYGNLDTVANLIVDELAGILSNFYAIEVDSERKHRTRLIKDTLALLGKKQLPGKPEYQVYAHGLSVHLRQSDGGEFKNAEWLFDMHWYVDGITPYTTLKLPMVMECEWNPRRRQDRRVAFSGIKYDFQKLMISNADLRVMIFKVTRLTDLSELEPYFIHNIANYDNLPSGSKFLFIGFYEKNKSFFYKEIYKA